MPYILMHLAQDVKPPGRVVLWRCGPRPAARRWYSRLGSSPDAKGERRPVGDDECAVLVNRSLLGESPEVYEPLSGSGVPISAAL